MELEFADDIAVLTEERVETQTPDMYRVVMHNDNYTAMEFVVEVLVSIFQKSAEEAVRLMMKIHKRGQATVGVYSYDIAYSRVRRAHAWAEKLDFPLKCSIIPEERGEEK